MKRKYRLSSSTEFKRVRRSGKSYAHPLIVLIAHANPGQDTRIGVAAGRALGKAVRRNRAKRLIRAALQPHLASLQPGWNIILIARHPMSTANYQETQGAISELLQRAGLIRDDHAAG